MPTTLNRISGKSGILIIAGIGWPVVNFSLSRSTEINSYRVSNSSNYLKRVFGVESGTFTVTGIGEMPGWSTTNYTPETLKFGWDVSPGAAYKYIELEAALKQIEVRMNFSKSTEINYTWTATFDTYRIVDIINEPTAFDYAIDPGYQLAGCYSTGCLNVYPYSNDPYWDAYSGTIQEVTSAVYTKTISRIPIYTAASFFTPTCTPEGYDATLSLQVQSKFDHWLDDIGLTKYTYRLYDDVGTYWELLNGTILSVDNFVTNIETGELLSATVNIGANHG